MVISVLALAFALAAADPPAARAADPAASPSSPAVAAAAPKKAADPNERICWTEKMVGSHLAKEVCATRAEREQMELEGREALRRNDRTRPSGLTPH